MRTHLTFVLAVALSAAAVPATLAQTDARQRTVLVTATRDGAPVDTLTPEDVIVREDGVAREVISVEPVTDPVDLVLVVDNSQASTRAIQDLRLGLEKFVSTFADPHTITLITVADRPTVQVGPTKNKAQLLRAVQRLFAQPDAGAYFVDGVIEAAKALDKREPARGAILGITSFGIEFSNSFHQAALDALARSGATLHVLELQDTTTADRLNSDVRERNALIDQGTAGTGGGRELLIANPSLTDALQKMGRLITSQFAVVYGRPDRLIPPRKVEVSSARQGLQIRGNVLQANRTTR